MIKNKYIGVISIGLLLFSLIFLIVLSNNIDIETTDTTFEYTTKLFDDSYVHTIDIQMSEEDWQSLLDNAMKEEYYVCDVVVDGVTFYNVGIRAKGNTSLSQIASDDTTDRYSFKIKFDEYTDNYLCYGLDKLALNNLMADATYMKDYIVYDMMNYVGANAPLSAYMNITVNGNPWGLYLGVECIDESFLIRNYGNEYGELYKPETMGGGMGNEMGEFGGGPNGGNNSNENRPNGANNFNGEFSGENGGMQPPEGFRPMENNNSSEDDVNNIVPPENNGFPEGVIPNNGQFENNDGSLSENTEIQDGGTNLDNIPPQMGENNQRPNMGGAGNDRVMQGFRGSNDSGADLVYTDDSFDSYSVVFEGAKTVITDSDKQRLINSLQVLGSGEDLETVIDIENTLKYWVVHNFVDNYDGYTGNMLHNYYLYEKNGIMTMLPWDYNLAFGGFSMGGKGNDMGIMGNNIDDATSMVNKSIDYPLESATEDDRPFWGKLIQNEEYKDLYHQYFSNFLVYFESGYFEEKIDSVYEMILPYVQNDTTAFYTEEEFKVGVETLKEFCLLRSESISKQLSGEIDIEGKNTENYVDASHLNLSDMGTQKGMDKNDMGQGKEFSFNGVEDKLQENGVNQSISSTP